MQGIAVESYSWNLKPNQARAAAGNAMCVPVLMLVLEAIVPFVARACLPGPPLLPQGFP